MLWRTRTSDEIVDEFSPHFDNEITEHLLD
jgi:hypothetical protein